MSAAPLQRSPARRIACAVVADEIERLRAADMPRAEDGDWPETMPIGEEGLGLDSLEQLGAIGALAETFELDDSILADGPPLRVGDWIDWIMRGQAAGIGRLTVRTSGSTGVPRPCVHALADLLDEAAYLATRIPDRRRVVALVPAHHLYGIIWTALLPAELDVPVVVRAVGTPLGLTSGDLVVAVPDQWRAMLRLVRRIPEDVIGVSSAGSLDETVAAGLLTAGLVRLIDVYGSSETGAIAMRDVPATVYDLLPRWQLEASGDDDWSLVSRGGVAALPDHVERVGDRGLRPIGRRDGAVKIAGHNVWPEHVAGVLRAVSGVADVAVRLQGNGRLKAFIVPEAGRDRGALAAAVERHAAAHLADHQRPKSLTFGDGLPRNAMGKLQDWN